MEQLKQESHELKQKLKLAASMEASYLDEIDELKSALKAAAVQSEESARQKKSSPDADHYEELLKLEDRAVTAECRLSEALAQLELGRQHQAELMDRLPGNTSSPELSMSPCTNQSLSDPMALAREIAQLQEELANKETSTQAERSKLQRKVVEAEEECLQLRDYVSELERHLKSMQAEVGDVRAELEAAQLLVNSTEKSRGNSVFSELEDRRIRAEQLVVKQRQRIDELELASRKTQAEWKRKLAETVQRLDVRARERDTQLVHELTNERQRLLDENVKFNSQIKHMTDLQLDNNRNTVKVSKAFQLEENSQCRLIKALESTIKRLEQQITEKSAAEESLRDRLLSSAMTSRRLKDQLWQQSDVNEQLTRLVENLKQMNNKSDENGDQIAKSRLKSALEDDQAMTVQANRGVRHSNGPQPTEDAGKVSTNECNPS